MFELVAMLAAVVALVAVCRKRPPVDRDYGRAGSWFSGGKWGDRGGE
jgi:hypothetical protein